MIDRFDHTNLNVDERFRHEVPTTENLCIAIHNLLAEHFVHADLERVRVEETRNNFFEYAGRGKAWHTQQSYVSLRSAGG